MTVAFIITATIALFFIVRCYKLAKEVLELQKTVISQNIDMLAENDIVKENFLKFVSDSREWAYQYIEEVQESINKFKDEVGPVIDYFDNYGEVVLTPLNESMQKVSAAYKDLIRVLPKDDTQ